MVINSYQVTISNLIIKKMAKSLPKFVPLLYGSYFNIRSLISKSGTAKKAFHTFCTVRKGRVLPQQAEFLETAKDQCHKINGLDIQTYRWHGGGKTVLLVHGWESNTYRWRNLILKLREADLNIIAFDAPGHGYSTGTHLHAPLYADTVQHLIETYSPDHLVGHSFGGMVLLYNEYRFPNPAIKKMITIGSPSEFYELIAHYQRLLNFNTRVMKVLETYVKDRFGFEIKEFSTPRFVKTNTKKGLLFHDKLDAITPYQSSVRVQANWSGSQLHSTEGLGHSMHQDEVNDMIVDFLVS